MREPVAPGTANDDGQRLAPLVSVSSFLIMLLLKSLLGNAISASRSVCSAWWAVVTWLLAPEDDDTAVVDHEDDAIATAPPPPPPRGPRRQHCEQCAPRGTSLSVSDADVTAVIASLGLMDGAEDAWSGHQGCGGCAAMAVVDELAEAKVASEAELREAFHVFDRDDDGFVTPAELWNVMRRLGVPEGARYEDCRRMVDAQDGDGDGRVSFRDFRAMMENAV